MSDVCLYCHDEIYEHYAYLERDYICWYCFEAIYWLKNKDKK